MTRRINLSNAADYEIYIDASLDLDYSWIEENGIHIIPMKYVIDDKEYLMDRPQTEEELKIFYDKMRAGSITGTSQITPYTYEQLFSEAAAQKKDILYLALSSGLSSTYDSSLTGARAVMEDHPDVRIECVDTLGGTGGMGLLLMLAIKARKEGMSLSDNAAMLRDNALKVCYWFMVEDLIYLKRGVNISKQRGVPRAVKYLLECYQGAVDTALENDVIVAHADCRERAEKLAEEVRRINPAARIQVCPMGPVIGAHTGPGFVAVIHFGNRNYR